MFFLLRTAFWITLVLVLIPLGSDQEDSEFGTIDPVSAYFAAQAAVSDLGGFCDRNPSACKTGGEALSALGAQARDGARIVYEFLDEKVAKPEGGAQLDPVALETSAEAQLTTGSTDGFGEPGMTTISDLPSQVVDRALDAPEMGAAFGAVPRPNPRSSHRT